MKNLSIPFARPMISKEEIEATNKVLSKHILTHGPHCRNFEKDFGAFHNNSFAVTLSNCTSALFLALKSLDIGIGDEVIVPAMTHIATAHSVLHTGANVVFADIDCNTGNIDPTKIIQKINKKTKAVIIVHYVGLPCTMDEIMEIINGNNIVLIEDCAAALGATYNNKLVGTFGYAGCFSFYPTKHITTMEGGMLISQLEEHSSLVRKISAFGYTKNLEERSVPGIYDIDQLGYNFRMSEVSAAIGIEQLKKLKLFIKTRKSNALIIREELKKNNNLDVLPAQHGKSISSNFCVNVILKIGGYDKRNKLIMKLKEKNIGTSVHYPVCIPESLYYKNKVKDINESFPIAEYFAENTISLPCGPHLTEEEVKAMCKVFIESLEEVL